MDWIKWMGHAIGVSEGAEAQISEPVAKLRYLYKVYTETRGEEVPLFIIILPPACSWRVCVVCVSYSLYLVISTSDKGRTLTIIITTDNNDNDNNTKQKKEVALSRVIQLFIAIFGHKTAEGDDEMGEGDHTPKAGSALITDPAKPDLERRYAHHRTQ
jgi:hypothetical protein